MRKIFLMVCALLFMFAIFIISTVAMADPVYYDEEGVDLRDNRWGHNEIYTFLSGIDVEPGTYNLTFSLQGIVQCIGCTWGDAGDIIQITAMAGNIKVASIIKDEYDIGRSYFVINLGINFQVDTATKLFINTWETVSHPPTEYWMLTKATLSGTFQPASIEPPPVIPPSSDDSPIPDIKANGSDDPITVNSGELVNISFSLDPGTEDGKEVDWFIGAISPHGSFPILKQTLPLSELSEATILEMPLHLGFWLFYAILDDNPNGILDRLTWYDYVVVISSPD